MSSSKTGKVEQREAARPRPLTRERILREGLAMLDREGPTALSMRRLSAQLGVSPMALYNHVGGKEDLLYGIAEIALDAVQYAPQGGDWREQIRVCFGELRKACLAHPGIVRLIETAEMLPSSIFRPMEVTLAALQRAGIDPQDALRAFCLLINFTMGQVSYQVRGPFPGADASQAIGRGELPPAVFPASAAAARAASVSGWDFDAAFEFGISVILDGLAGLARDG